MSSYCVTLVTLAEHLHFFAIGFSDRPKQSSGFDPSFCFLIHLILLPTARPESFTVGIAQEKIFQSD